jgi:hypothetical protein
MYVLRGREKAHEIRGELFIFPGVLEVMVTSRPDALVVVRSGRPRPAEWLRTCAQWDTRFSAGVT